MRYVLDASIGIKRVMNEVDSVAARRIRDDVRHLDRVVHWFRRSENSLP